MPSKRSSTASTSGTMSAGKVSAGKASAGKASRPAKKTSRKPAAKPAAKPAPKPVAKRQRAAASGPAGASGTSKHDERFTLIGHVFGDVALMRLALTHASVSDTRMASNERLEFLGDAVLGQVICEHLYRRYPDRLEGDLTKLKSYLVSREMCAQLVREAGFHRMMSIGKGMISVDQLPKSVLAGLFESLVGAIYLDGGSEAARAFVLRHMEPHIERTLQLGHQENYKSVLQQLAQQAGLGSPTYSVMGERGPDHEKNFEIRAQIGDRAFTSCWGMSKKAAEQGAALHALRELGFVVDGPTGPQVQVPQSIADTMP
jgi:ribonuclease-3